LKQGLDSFHLDCHTNEKIAEIEAEYGLKGFGVIIRLWQKIYAEKGYYCEWTSRSALLFLAQWFGGNSGVNLGLINDVIERSLEIGIFDRNLYEKYSILTSKRIQEQYFEATKRRKVLKTESAYLLVGVPKTVDDVNIIEENAYKKDENVNISKQSKVKESKVKESKDISIKDTCCTPAEMQRVVDEWNTLSVYGISEIKALGANTVRYKMLKARIAQYGVDEVLNAIDNIRSSDFLRGRVKDFVIAFDWFVKPNNFIKVWEGRYNNTAAAGTVSTGNPFYDSILKEGDDTIDC